MNKVQFITQAAAQQLNLSASLNLDMLKAEHMELILGGQCICCAGNVAMDADYDELGIIGYTQELFCEGCVDHIPAAALLAYGVISQKEYDNLCNPFDCYTPMDSNDLRDLIDPVEYQRDAMASGRDELPGGHGGMWDGGDDELPF